MSIEQIWAGIQAGGEQTEDQYPEPGMYVPQVVEGKAFTSKKGEFTIVVGYRLEDGRQWGDVRSVTKGGVLQDGRVKAAKIMLRQLGVNPELYGAALDAALGQIVGRYYSVEIVQSDRLNATTGKYLLNTNITGVASPPAQGAPAQPVAAPVQFAQPPEVQAPQFQQPPQNNTAGAQFGNDIPWENAPGVQPSHVQQG